MLAVVVCSLKSMKSLKKIKLEIIYTDIDIYGELLLTKLLGLPNL